MRGYGKEGVVEAIRRAGGEIYAITSEPQSLAANAQQHWETGIEHVGDPHQEILDECQERGLLSLFTNDWEQGFSRTNDDTWVSHPKGYFQPGVLSLRREGRVLYRWRCRPSRQNIGGAVARPTASYVWDSVRAALDEPADAPDVRHDDAPVLDTRPILWPLFVALLVSNGWFLRPTPFDQRTGEDTVPTRIRNAGLRLLFFVAAWIAAFAILPLWIVSLALVAWIVKITPGIRMVHRLFQNVSANEEPSRAGLVRSLGA